ncbi:MAG: hypothetical protein WD557_10650 [Dehalococcoidia bacterium]
MMRGRAPLWLVGAVAAVALLVAGGMFWAREWAVADPNLENYALELLPPSAEIVISRGMKCDATNGWDRIYNPEDTCHELFWIPDGNRRPEERLDAVHAEAERLGWSLETSPEGPVLRRPGYNALVRVMRDDLLDQCRSAPPDDRFCGDFVVVRAD